MDTASKDRSNGLLSVLPNDTQQSGDQQCVNLKFAAISLSIIDSARASENAMRAITKVQDVDVLTWRGGRAVQHPDHKLFMNSVKPR
jgi:hypothetical protein